MLYAVCCMLYAAFSEHGQRYEVTDANQDNLQR